MLFSRTRRSIVPTQGSTGTEYPVNWAKMLATLSVAPLQTPRARRRPHVSQGATIRTVLKDVSPDTITQATLFHEHLSFEWARVAPQSNRSGPAKDPAPVLEQLDVAANEGVGCIVDAGTTDVGRDNELLKQIASRTSVHIVACGGLYMERTYPQDVATKSEDQIADDLVRDAAAPMGRSGEIGETPNAAMSAAERKVFRAVGKAHLLTRLPIFTHNAYGTGPNVPRDAGLGQLDAFESVGVAPDAWRSATVAASTIPRPRSSSRSPSSAPTWASTA